MNPKRGFAAFAALLLSASLLFAARVGNQAPNFTGRDTNGKAQTLSSFRGKYVVLEWHNHDCPYTRKHYASGNMQALQREWRAKGVIWFTVISSAPGEQGYMTAQQENAYLVKMKADPTAVILDTTGAIGHLYGATTTPQMFVIDPAGKLIYDGAIDDHATTEVSDVKVSTNYVSEALSQAMAGKAVAISYTRPYGCSVKYAQ